MRVGRRKYASTLWEDAAAGLLRGAVTCGVESSPARCFSPCALDARGAKPDVKTSLYASEQRLPAIVLVQAHHRRLRAPNLEPHAMRWELGVDVVRWPEDTVSVVPRAPTLLGPALSTVHAPTF